ncbi:HPP family protein [Acaryochloris sp. 'Moss Beach']|uniref:HPP family protein n=1 Tax=Acaryochloris sp. 'Moss Beach' TaxID=2740837 RepID=UPI001F448FED|nr:HPP family protein [Acaryochloris sp. 'Moss Beach']UJB68796.1 HPP family protein [Acaryochloris sp. 'Moss Beach']
MDHHSSESAASNNLLISPQQSFLEFSPSKQMQEILQQYERMLEQQQNQIEYLNLELQQLHSTKSLNFKGNKIWFKLRQYLSGIHGSSSVQPRFSLSQILFTYIGSFLGIAALAYLSMVSDYPLIAAPFGAAAVLVFAVPNSPLAQPRNLIFGNLLGGVVSVVMVYLFGSEPWVMALSVATAIKVMQLTKTLHPPGGAVALVGVMSQASWNFVLTPVVAGSVILLFCTFVFNNLIPERSYPRHWL